MNNISNALNAYQQALGRIGAQTPAAEKAPAAAGFQDLVQSAVENAVDMSKQSEAVTLKGITGKADIQDVVLAVSNAEIALETVVAVRDNAIKAYKEIMSVPI